MKKWFEYYSLKEMYADWAKQHKPEGFVTQLKQETKHPIYKIWIDYIDIRHDMADIQITYSQEIHYNYHNDRGNIKPLDIGRGPLPGMQQPVAESKQVQLNQYDRLNKTSHPTPTYHKYLRQIIDEYHRRLYSDKQILQDMQDGSLYIHNPDYGLSEFIRRMAQENTPFDKIKSYSRFIARKMYQKLKGKTPDIKQISFDQIKNSLERYLNTQYGENYVNTKDIRSR